MSEIKRVATPVANTMMVLEQGQDIPRSPSSLTRWPLKKSTSEGLVSLSAEPGNVKFEVETQKRPESGGSRCSSAGRIERKLQLFKKKEEVLEDPRRNSADGIIYRSEQTENPLVKQINATNINDPTTSKTQLPHNNKSLKIEKGETESSESESESEESTSEEEERANGSNDENKTTAPVEMKAEFLKFVMSEEYEKAKEICQNILLLEPDNATCMEFHSLIVQKIEQENMDDSDDDSDDSEDDDDDDEDDDEDDDSSSSSEESETDDDDDEEVNHTAGLNLIMGGLPIKPQPK